MESTLTFKSKKGLEIILPLIVLLGGLSIFYAFEGIWVGVLINLSVATFIFHMIISTDYTIKGSELIVRCGFFFNKAIKIESIRKIEQTRSIMSSPAISIDRIEVFFNRFDSIIISPKDKIRFVESLKALNADIEINLKSKE